MARRATAETFSVEVRDRLRREILAGHWAPGSRLQPAQLADAYDLSTTVVREALTRLTGERLIELKPNKGFFVPNPALEEVQDLNELRIVTEEMAVRLALQRGDAQWQSDLEAAHRELESTPLRQPTSQDNLSDEWVSAHRGFHAALSRGCGFPTLIDLIATLTDGSELYRRWSVPPPISETRDVRGEDRAILQAALGRDAELTSLLIRRHYEVTLQKIVDARAAEPRHPPRS